MENLIFLETVDSTNNYLKNLALKGANENTVIIASEQTAGKGSRNRNFYSEKGGVYLSVLLKPDLSGFDVTLITSATAVAVSETIDEISGKTTQIKWVNDVYLQNKKVCGILCESVITPDGKIPFVIVGIGVNLFKLKNGFNNEIRDIAGYIFEEENKEIYNQFIDLLLKNCFKYFENLSNKKFLTEYKNRNLVIGKKIEVIKGNTTYNALGLDIDDNCRLKVQYANLKTEYLSSGEVKIKL